MARRYRMLLVLGFSDCSWAECDVDRGWPAATRNALERANLLLEGYFGALYVHLYISMFSDKPPCMPLCFGFVERRCNHSVRGGRGFFFFYIFFLSPFFEFFLFLSLLLPLHLLS